MLFRSDEKGRNPFEVVLPCNALPGSVVCFPTIAPVPAGKRLVLEYVNANFYTGTSSAPYVTLQDDTETLALLPVTFAGSNTFAVNASVLLYVDPGKTITLRAGGIAPAGSAGTVTLTGYLVDTAE